MKNIAIIPARSGSKGLPDKNIKLLDGRPLLVYSIVAAQQAGIFDEIMVSTDSEKYADIAKKNGASVPFLRSPEQSGDKAGSWGVVQEVLSNYRGQGKEFDSVCLLQPTSPLRTAEDIIDAYGLLTQKHAQAITSVCEMEHSPLWSMTLPEDLSLKEFREKTFRKGPRQELKTYYRINGAIYIRLLKYADNEIYIMDDKEYAYIMARNKSIDIDVAEDFDYAEYMIKAGIKDR